ncbi:MAG TPA: hypothetical protein VLF87_02490, partial [Patescibacteria group bacterium]|nr:hypothetical protein [Patescibacteria group bacterium]
MSDNELLEHEDDGAEEISPAESSELASLNENTSELGGPGSLYKPGDSGGSLRSQAAKLLLNRKSGAVGGGIAGILVIGGILIFGGGSLEMLTVSSRLLNSNRIMNFSLQRRFANSMSNVITAYGKSGTPGELIQNAATATQYDAKLAKAGFEVTRDTDGVLTNLTFGSGANTVRVDTSSVESVNEFLSLNRDASAAFHSQFDVVARTWRGKAFDKVLGQEGLDVSNFIDRFLQKVKQEKPDATPVEESTLVERLASTEQTHPGAVTGGLNADAENNKLSKEDKAAGKQNFDSNKAAENSSQNQSSLLDNATQTTESQAAQTDNAISALTADAAGGAADELATVAAGGEEAGLENVSKNLPEILAKYGIQDGVKNFAGGFAAIADPLLVPQTACKARGTIQVVANARNIALAIELARFTTRYLTAADHQKAGLLSSEGLRVFMIYMHTKDVNGKSYLNAPGLQNLMQGSNSQKVSGTSLAKYSTSREYNGVFGAILNVIDHIPLANVSCAIANNAIINFGVTAANGVLAVFTGGTSAAAESTFSFAYIAVNILGQLAMDIATPFLIQLTTHMVMSSAKGVLIGDGLASGNGSLAAMDGNSHGLRVATQQQVAELSGEEQQFHQNLIAHESIFQRYFALNNTDSLVNNMSMATLANPAFTNVSTLTTSWLGGLSKPLGLLSSITDLFMPGRAKAAADSQQMPDCGYPDINGQKIATDQFCNPMVVAAPNLNIDDTRQILLNNNMIDAKGSPQGEFTSYISDCQSGRAGIIYKAEVSSSGTTSTDEPDTQCISSGTPLNGDNIGRYDRFSAYYGYLVDLQGMSEEINPKASGSTLEQASTGDAT